jgi:peptidyl-prolyl cis-trans isomerase SurA
MQRPCFFVFFVAFCSCFGFGLPLTAESPAPKLRAVQMKFSFAEIIAGTLIVCVPQVRAELANGIKAIVHDAVVTYDDVGILSLDGEEMLARRFYNRRDLFEKEVDKLRRDTLDQLVERQLILHEFKTAGYALPESVVDELVDEKIRSDYTDRRTLTRTLNGKGTTFEKFRQAARDNFVISALSSKNISQEILISPHKVEAYYQAHRDDFKVEDEVKIRLLTLPQLSDAVVPSAEQTAEEILTKLKAGASFSEMASRYSQGAPGKQEGIWYEASQLTRHLADIAASLQPGQYSSVMSRSSGDDYWICQYEHGRPVLGRHYQVERAKEKLVEEKRFDDASASTNLPSCKEFFLLFVDEKRTAHVKPLNEELRGKIEQEFMLQERARLKKQWIEKLKKKTFVRVFPGG